MSQKKHKHRDGERETVELTPDCITASRLAH